MKDIKRLELSLRVTEGLYLALMTLCVSLPCALLLQGNREGPGLWWGLGAVLPVELIAGLCYWLKPSPGRVLACLGVTALSALLSREDARWVFYVFCCGLMLLSGLVMDRPKGRLIFTVPKAYHAVYGLIVYALGRIVSNQLLCVAGIVLGALQILCYFFYTGRARLLSSIRDSRDTELAPGGMIRLSRSAMLAYFLLAILVLAAIPMLLRRPVRVTEAPAGTGVPLLTQEPYVPEQASQHIIYEPDYGTPISYEGAGKVLLVLGLGFVGCVAVLVLLAVWQYIRMFLGEGSRHKDQAKEEGWSLERLSRPEGKAERERVTGYEKRLRRRYERLILRRTRPEAELRTRTPTELETLAGLGSSPEARALHALYQQTRYSPEETTRENYRRFRELEKQLEASSRAAGSLADGITHNGTAAPEPKA